MATFLAAGGAFLLAVLWMDLLFDVQVLKYRNAGEELPEAVLVSIADYYRRATTEAWPMNRMIAVVMLLTFGGSAGQLLLGRGSPWLAGIAVGLCGVPIALARARVVPNAVRLGRRVDSLVEQSRLARAICKDHLFCLASIAGFTGLQLTAALR